MIERVWSETPTTVTYVQYQDDGTTLIGYRTVANAEPSFDFPTNVLYQVSGEYQSMSSGFYNNVTGTSNTPFVAGRLELQPQILHAGTYNGTRWYSNNATFNPTGCFVLGAYNFDGSLMFQSKSLWTGSGNVAAGYVDAAVSSFTIRKTGWYWVGRGLCGAAGITTFSFFSPTSLSPVNFPTSFAGNVQSGRSSGGKYKDSYWSPTATNVDLPATLPDLSTFSGTGSVPFTGQLKVA